MRPLFALAVIAGLSGPTSQDGASIMADVELFEWTPPMQLTLDLDTGRYVVRPSAAKRPRVPGRPDPRHGTWGEEALRDIRPKFAIAAAEGVSNTGASTRRAKATPPLYRTPACPA